MLDWNTLRRARRAGRVHDAAQLIGLGRDRVHHVRLAELAQLLHAQDREPVREVGRQLVDIGLLDLLRGLVIVYYVADVRSHGQGSTNDLEELRIAVDGLGAGLLQRMAQAVLAERIVGRGDGHGL